MANTIITKNSSTASAVPTSGDLVQGELAVNVTDKRLFTEDSGGNVVEVGTNPSTMAVAGNATVGGTLGVTGVATLTANPVLSAGTANGLAFLNASKVLTSGSALTFDGTNLGIGTSSPARLLTLNSGASTGQLQITNSTSGTATTDGFQIAHYTSGATQLWSYENSYMAFGTNNTERLRIDSSGNVGIGTSSPIGVYSTNLTISGAASAGLFFEDTGYEATGDGLGSISYDGGAFTFGTASRSGTGRTGFSSRAVLDSSGNLGLGVTPSAWGATFKALEVGRAGSGFFSVGTDSLQISNNYYYNGTNYIYSANGYAERYHMVSGQHVWYTAPSGTAGTAISFTQAMTLDASGNLGIGTSSPANNGAGYTALTVNGTTDSRTEYWVNGSAVGKIYTNTDFNLWMTGSGAMRFSTSGTERARIDSSGNLLVGTTTASSAAGSQVRANAFAGSNKVSVTALNTNYVIYGAINGIVVVRDDTTGGSALWLLDPNQGIIQVASNLPTTITFVFSAGYWYIRQTAGIVPTNYSIVALYPSAQ